MRHLSIGKKLLLGMGLLIALVMGLGAVAEFSLGRMQANMDIAVGSLWERAKDTAQLRAATEVAYLGAKTSLLNVLTKDDVHKSMWREKETAALSEIAEGIAKMPALKMETSRQAMARIKANRDAWQQAMPRINELADHGKAAEAQVLSLKEILPLYEAMVQDTDTIWGNVGILMTDLRASGEQAYAAARWMIAGALLLGLAMGAIVLWMVRSLTKTLRHTVSELNAGGGQMASASTQIASTSQSLSQGASEQAASIEEISASMEEMTAMTRRNGDSSAEATVMMSETVKQVDRSHVALSDMVASMSAIKASSEKVAKINKTIDEIAFQTNILALNAAVEAARAGEAGMGFAVVADEVRNLAQRSAVAAKDTAALIEESISNSNQGAQRLEQVSTAIRGITDGASKVKSLLDEVNESSKQQGQGIQQVSTAIQQVSTVTQTSAASAEESAAAAQQLSGQSRSVQDLVRVLEAMLEGGSAAKPASQTPRGKGRNAAAPQSPVLKARLAKPIPAPNKQDEDPFPMETSDSGSFRSF